MLHLFLVFLKKEDDYQHLQNKNPYVNVKMNVNDLIYKENNLNMQTNNIQMNIHMIL